MAKSRLNFLLSGGRGKFLCGFVRVTPSGGSSGGGEAYNTAPCGVAALTLESVIIAVIVVEAAATACTGA